MKDLPSLQLFQHQKDKKKSDIHQAHSVSSLICQIDDLNSLSNRCCVIHFSGWGVVVFVILRVGRRFNCLVLYKVSLNSPEVYLVQALYTLYRVPVCQRWKRVPHLFAKAGLLTLWDIYLVRSQLIKLQYVRNLF